MNPYARKSNVPRVIYLRETEIIGLPSFETTPDIDGLKLDI
jgi:hypothetical protein